MASKIHISEQADVIFYSDLARAQQTGQLNYGDASKYSELKVAMERCSDLATNANMRSESVQH